MLQSFMEEIIGEIPKLTERKVYRIFCSMKARNKRYGIFGLGKRDGFRFGVSERQMQYFVNLMLDYGFLSVAKEVRSTRGFKCRVFKASEQLIEYFEMIKDYVKKKFEYIDPVLFVKTRFPYKIKNGKIKFKVNGDKYLIHQRGRFKDKIYSIPLNKVINPYHLITN